MRAMIGRLHRVVIDCPDPRDACSFSASRLQGEGLERERAHRGDRAE